MRTRLITTAARSLRRRHRLLGFPSPCTLRNTLSEGPCSGFQQGHRRMSRLLSQSYITQRRAGARRTKTSTQYWPRGNHNCASTQKRSCTVHAQSKYHHQVLDPLTLEMITPEQLSTPGSIETLLQKSMWIRTVVSWNSGKELYPVGCPIRHQCYCRPATFNLHRNYRSI